jgi:phage baseplate assembly protein W
VTDLKDFLGRGWAYPVERAITGDIAMVAAEEDIRQSIRLILETEPGERVMRPDFGCPLRHLLFEPINTNTIGLIKHRVEVALVAWEPRIDVHDVTVTTPNPALGKVEVNIRYLVRSTNTFYNLVYPFYLREGGGP